MKKHPVCLFVLAGAVMLGAGCRSFSPAQLGDDNSQPLPEPISYYGDIELFEEKVVPLKAEIKTVGSIEDASLADELKTAMLDAGIDSVKAPTPCDFQVILSSAYSQVTPEPQCRMSHLLGIEVVAPDRTKLLPEWKHQTDSSAACATMAEAKSKMLPLIRAAVANWGKTVCRNNISSNYQVAVLRFRLSNKLIELNRVVFEEDQRLVLDTLRKTKGVVNVRLIEANESTRVASFRVLYRRDIISGALGNTVKIEK